MRKLSVKEEAQAARKNRERAASGCGGREKYRHERNARDSEFLLISYANAIIAGGTLQTHRVIGWFES